MGEGREEEGKREKEGRRGGERERWRVGTQRRERRRKKLDERKEEERRREEERSVMEIEKERWRRGRNCAGISLY